MSENIDLNSVLNNMKSIDNKTYKQVMKVLEKRLESLQESIKEYQIPVILAFDGWSAAGKGTLISRVLHSLDPRFFNVFTMGKMTEERRLRPFLWSFWTKTPAKGRISIFDKSWCRLILPEHCELSTKEKAGFYYDISAFEQQLKDDGFVILKFFLEISKEEQNLRFKELERKPETAWRVNQHDWQQNKDYRNFSIQFNEMVQKTNFKGSEWSIVDADDTKFAIVKTIRIIIDRIEAEIEHRKQKAERPVIYTPDPIVVKNNPLNIDLFKEINDKEYKVRLDFLQQKISEQGYKMYTKRKSVVIVYEGWDAAGKGGNIKRLTERIDPRAYEVVPIAAPTAEELSHHYLWRFFNRMPKDGHMTIFDRSWYGRVMVERIERITPPDDCARAYKEINDMELHLANHGVIIFKFWLQIDQEEQLARFEARQKDPLKNYKITDEDWRNREKWDQYEAAVGEMLKKTHTSYAPWTIVESNDKKYARIKVLEIVTRILDKLL
ncbi:MAG: polyphosphate:AMP phosphotransferase [Clostridiales bacterium]|jgi:polyphosphate:AMP phosphotransferase|nr:polyphosphate:AMP phosphotransferase [Clostridiales bacterium]